MPYGPYRQCVACLVEVEAVRPGDLRRNERVQQSIQVVSS